MRSQQGALRESKRFLHEAYAAICDPRRKNGRVRSLVAGERSGRDASKEDGRFKAGRVDRTP